MEKPSFEALSQTLLQRAEVQQMANYTQHGHTTTLAHTVMVARASLTLARRLHLQVNEQNLVDGALLHDFYLYDWHDRTTSRPKHATMHPLYAADNAARLLQVNNQVRNIIETHMWPLPPTRAPRSKEAWVVCVADKWCSLKETLSARLPRPYKQHPVAKPPVSTTSSRGQHDL